MRRRLKVPDHPPVAHRSLLDLLFDGLPYESKGGRLTVDSMVTSTAVGGSTVRVRRLLTFELALGDGHFEFSLPIGRSKFGENWTPEREPWLIGCDCDECSE